MARNNTLALIYIALVVMVSLLTVGCRQQPATQGSLAQARRGFTTKLVRQESDGKPVPEPPAGVFQIVHYRSPVGDLAAYLSIPAATTTRHPAIIWITGGDSHSIDESVWQPADPSNDQSARAFREAGIVLLFPSLRGGNDNPGHKEGFYGEVDDVLAAADYLAKQDFVDPNRIYLGGHSTGGTLVLLTAECSSRFRAVFSFGPVADVAGYPQEFLPFDTSNDEELKLRAPVRWLHSVQSPVFVFEGTGRGNIDSLRRMQEHTDNPMIHFFAVTGADHFSILAPTTHLITDRILADDGATSHISVTSQELDGLFRR